MKLGHSNCKEFEMFDYIIVGGGSAGCVLANRLSEDVRHSVCLIEAGSKDTNPLIHMPGGIFAILPSQILNWNFWTTPQKNCNNRKMYCPRGRTLGGSSSINAMCYIRGNPRDYDQWAELGNSGWSYKEVLPYFKKLENFTLGENEFHGSGGPLNIVGPSYINPLTHAFLDAAKEAGYSINSDFNGKAQEGVGFYHMPQIKGKRCSNAVGYLRSADARKNLTIITRAQAVQILFKDKRAIGIRYIKNKKYIDIFAKKEVIIASGAIGSPHLLLLSGVGPIDELKKHRIEVIHPLPGVGKNLQDHLDIHITCLEKTRLGTSLHPSNWWNLIKNLFRYIFKKEGELTSNFVTGGGFLKSNVTQLTPDLQWHFIPIYFTDHGQKLLPAFKHYAYTLLTCYLHPKSRGEITLQSSDPLIPPNINPNYLDNNDDLDMLITGFKKARELLSEPAFAPHLLKEVEPGETIQTDEQIAQYIRERSETVYHPVGTCKMGVDNMAVVDPELKVHGLQSLRIVDASIMPTIISGNTNAPTTMIAEKAASMILSS